MILLSISFINCEEYEDIDEFDVKIYDKIEVILRGRYPSNQNLTMCMVESMKDRQIAGRFYSKEIMENQKELEKAVETYVENAELVCKSGKPDPTPEDNGKRNLAEDTKSEEKEEKNEVDKKSDSFTSSPWRFVIIGFAVLAVIAGAI